MKIAGETKAIVWHIFRTYRFKQQIHFFSILQFYNFFYELTENTIMIYNTAYTMFTPENCQGFLLREPAEAIWESREYWSWMQAAGADRSYSQIGRQKNLLRVK
jgi:hypothetical protein